MLRQFPEASQKASLWGAFFIVCVLPCAVAAADCAPPGAWQEVAVARVVDGDTLRLRDGRRVRLIGINTPELARDGRPAELLAEAARERLQQLLAASGGRSLAYAYGVDGRSWAELLLSAGLGYAVAIAPDTALSACQFAAERRARAAGRGVWRQEPQAVGALRAAGFALLRVRVQRVERNRGGVWLTAGELTVRVPPAWLGRFALPALQALAGREVEVRGWVVPRQRGWLLELSDPAMLERR